MFVKGPSRFFVCMTDDERAQRRMLARIWSALVQGQSSRATVILWYRDAGDNLTDYLQRGITVQEFANFLVEQKLLSEIE
jgi:hypothetical protein